MQKSYFRYFKFCLNLLPVAMFFFFSIMARYLALCVVCVDEKITTQLNKYFLELSILALLVKLCNLFKR